MPPKNKKAQKNNNTSSKKIHRKQAVKKDDLKELDFSTEDPDDIEEDQGVDEEDLDDKKEIIRIDPNTRLSEYYEYVPEIHKQIIFISPENRKTSEIMTKFEYTDIISQRAKQIEKGSAVFTDVGDLTDPIQIAEKELRDKRCPLDIVRMITDYTAERWHANEMGINWE
jgi:DNA-directed RNA polymerases I, II, and III subunit RPABC2